MKKIKTGGNGGFVLIELLISMSLATLILGVVLFGYRVFTNNLAVRAAGQQVAVSVRQAQSQGVVNRQINTSADFANGYGVSFNLSDPTSYIVFSDKNSNGKYDGDTNCSAGTECLEKDSFKNNVSLYSFCGTDPANTRTCPPLAAQNLNVIFSSTNQEKASDAKIQFTDASGNILSSNYDSAQIFVGIGGRAPFSEVSVSSTGVIYVNSASTVPTTNHPPVITLNGANTMTVQIGSTFTDPGATASDTEDGDLTSSITTTGHVNTLIAGAYPLTYNVTDSGGLPATQVTRTVNVGASCNISFVALGQTARSWIGISVDSSNHNVYATDSNGDIYKQTAGAGDFLPLGQGLNNWIGISVDSSNHNVYVVNANPVTYVSNIYKQTAGTGNFVSLNYPGVYGFGGIYWNAVSVDSSNQDVYALGNDNTTNKNRIYKQTAGTGDFVPIDDGAWHSWSGISVDSSNHNVYVTDGTNIYKQTAGAGDFLSMGQTIRSWLGISVDSSNHDVYATTYGVSVDSPDPFATTYTYNGDIYKQTAGTGNFVATGQTSRIWNSISVDSSNHNVYATSHSIYATANSGDIYKYTPCP
jgi:Tfp pilus assembly protein FimT